MVLTRGESGIPKKPEARSQKPEAGSQKPEARSQKPEEDSPVRLFFFWLLTIDSGPF